MQAAAHQQSEFQTLFKALGYFRTHWWLILIEATLVFAYSLWNYSNAPKVYESYTSLLIDTSRKAAAASVLPGADRMSGTKRQNVAFLLTSEEAMERFRTTLTEYFNSEGRPAHLRALFPNGTAVPREALASKVNLTWDRNSDIYYAKCKASSPEAAYDLCLNYLNAIQTFYPEVGNRGSMMRKDFITRQINSYSRQIREGSQNLTEFQKRSSEFIEFIMKGLDDTGYKRLKDELNELKKKNDANRAIRKLLLASPNARRGENTTRNSSIEALTAQISELKYQLELTYASKSADRDLRIRNLETEIRRVSSQLGKLNEEEVAAVVRSPIAANSLRAKISELELEYKTNQVAISAIERQMVELRANETRFQPERIEYERLQNELSQRRELLNTLLAREQEAELEIAAGGAEIFKLNSPSRSGNRVSPQLAKFMFGALTTSLLIIAVTIMSLMVLLPRLDSEAEVQRLNLPVLGKIPNLPLASGHGFDDIPAAGFEYLRIMNYRILRETKELKCPIVVVSSANSREGKSTVIQLMALASQAPGRKTLLIDGDLLTAHPNRFFNMEEDASPGLKSILEGNAKGSSQGLITRTIHEGIHLLPRGGRMDPSAAPNFLEPLKAHIESWKKEFNLILIDTPPIFAANLPHQWTSLADLIILVTRIYVTRPKDILEALQTCKVFSKAPIGIALNGVTLTGAAKRSSNYYFSRKKARPTRLAA